MILFDIGAVLFLVGLMWIIWFLIKGNQGVKMSLIGGLIMFIAHYIVAGNQSVFSDLIF